MRPSPIHLLRKLIKVAAVLASLACRTATADPIGAAATSTTSVSVPEIAPPGHGLRWRAPIGHRQPHARDVPSESSDDLGHLSEEDRAVDRRLVICRGC